MEAEQGCRATEDGAEEVNGVADEMENGAKATVCMIREIEGGAKEINGVEKGIVCGVKAGERRIEDTGLIGGKEEADVDLNGVQCL